MTKSMSPPCVSVFAIRKSEQETRYLLIRRCCGGYLNGTWQMVTGKCEGGETASETALREIKEETGLKVVDLFTADALESIYLHTENKVIFVPVFVAFVEGEVQLSDEHDAYEWLPFEEARERLVWSEQRRVIEHVEKQFVKKSPNQILRIATKMKVVTRIGVYGIGLDETRILLVEQGGGVFRGQFDLPGGKMEAGEGIEETLRREWAEEVGMSFESMRLWGNLESRTKGIDESGNEYLFHRIGLIYEVEGMKPIEMARPELRFEWIELEVLRERKVTPFVAQWAEKTSALLA